MSLPTILIPISRDDYRVFVAASRLLRKEHGVGAPDAVTLIQFQFKRRTPSGVAKDYLDCVGDLDARRRVCAVVPRKARGVTSASKSRGRLDVLRSVRRPADLSRN